MKTTNVISRSSSLIGCAAMALALVSVGPSRLPAQDGRQHPHDVVQQVPTDPQNGSQLLLDTVRKATEKYKNVGAAMADGYALVFGCVSGDDYGAMGLHYLNGAILNTGMLDPTKPQIVIYEPQPDGSQKLIGADFLVFAEAWDKANSGPPQLMGQLFHYFPAPNRFGLPAFYTLHVWAWKDNPQGAFVNWHPNVSCQNFTAK